MTDMAIKGRAHSGTTQFTVTQIPEPMSDTTRLIVQGRRTMHLNPPLLNEAVTQRKRVSWWNIAAQETRAECINFIEGYLERELSYPEYASIHVQQENFRDGILTQVAVRLDKEQPNV